MTGGIEGVSPSGGGEALDLHAALNRGTKTSIQWNELPSIKVSELDSSGIATLTELIFDKLELEAEAAVGSAECLKPDRWEGLGDGEVGARFTDIPCPRATAVEVVTKRGKRYIHANEVTIKLSDVDADLAERLGDKVLSTYIASQGPLHSDQGRFWKAVADRSRVIIDVSQPRDGVSGYCPANEGGVREFGEDAVKVECTHVEEADHGIKIYTYKITTDFDSKDDANEKIVTRINYPSWKDYSSGSSKVVEYLHALNEHYVGLYSATGEEVGPSFIHCRAGVGRTGTTICSSAILKLHLLMSESGESLPVDKQLSVLKNATAKAKECRGPYTVQQRAQLRQILELGEDLRKREAGEVADAPTPDLSGFTLHLPETTKSAVEIVGEAAASRIFEPGIATDTSDSEKLAGKVVTDKTRDTSSSKAEKIVGDRSAADTNE